MKIQICLLGAIAMGLTGCITSKTVGVSDPMRVEVVRFDANHRAVFVHLKNGQAISVSEPSPDIAKEITGKLEAAVTGLEKATNANTKLEYASKVVDLAHRSQVLQIQREAMFRIEEMYANGALDKPQAQEAFNRVLVMVENIAKVELVKAQAEKAKASPEAAVEDAKAEKAQKVLEILNNPQYKNSSGEIQNFIWKSGDSAGPAVATPPATGKDGGK